MSNSTYWWQGTADDARINCTPAVADAFIAAISAQLNYTQSMAVSNPFIADVAELGLPTTGPNGVTAKNVGGAVNKSPRACAYSDGIAKTAVRMGGPSQPWCFFISVGDLDINIALALATPDFAIVPSGQQAQGGGFTGSPVTVVNAPSFPPTPLIPTP